MDIKGTFKKQANARIEDPILSLQDWAAIHGTSTFGQKTAGFQLIAKDTSKYLLSHCTIMASVMVEEDADWLIKPEASHLVNNNDDAWTNEVLKLSHKSFIGAFNFVEHYQNSQHAKGHILDSVLRHVDIAPNIWVYFCDILVATDLAHTQLVEDIRAEKAKYLSMGCVTDLVICSFCGAKVTDANTYCNHLAFQKGSFKDDDDGIARRVAELCGHKSLANGGVKFVEASWVATPAFPGAEKRSIVSESWEGPKTKYTKAASDTTSGHRGTKTASQHIDYQDLRLDDGASNADLRRRLM